MVQQDKFYKGLFFGALIGAAGGTVMGLLFAPHKGSDTQQILSGKLKHALEKAAELYEGEEEGEEEGEVYGNEAKKRSQEIIDTARQEASKILDEANSIIREIKGQPKVAEN
ncbi:YtxH domain-containing protein [Chlorobium sp. N1]|uniref:YtxH domain-containing protein n=1 Tax=Chlorobium sp. N1 TaxID=2491138 RepID=UPI00103D251A|nr:YtxH domain-containing protein [Chlorobium sp. N1]TCD47864.1 YtxH domain-containing protein [Chlorobium sp. N1]